MKRAAIIAAAVLALAAPFAWATTLRDRDDVTTAFDIAKTAGAHNRASAVMAALRLGLRYRGHWGIEVRSHWCGFMDGRV